MSEILAAIGSVKSTVMNNPDPAMASINRSNSPPPTSLLASPTPQGAPTTNSPAPSSSQGGLAQIQRAGAAPQALTKPDVVNPWQQMTTQPASLPTSQADNGSMLSQIGGAIGSSSQNSASNRYQDILKDWSGSSPIKLTIDKSSSKKG